MRLIWHGTAAVEAVNAKGRILFDPFVPLKGSPVDVSLDEYDGFPYVFVTHGHLDHIVSLPDIIKRNPGTKVYCTGTPYRVLWSKGIPKRNLVLTGYGQTHDICGFTVRLFHGRHAELPRATFCRAYRILSSPHRGNLPYIIRENRKCRENDETVFYQIESEGKTVSLMGSLNLRDEVDYPIRSDLLILPYNGWEDNYLPAVRVIERLKPKRVLLHHYDDTFPPLTENMDLSRILEKYEGRVSAMKLRKMEMV